MMLDNKLSVTSPIITMKEETNAEFCCISCKASFWVNAKFNTHGTIPNQTLFCTPCLHALKNSIIREKTENYGW